MLVLLFEGKEPWGVSNIRFSSRKFNARVCLGTLFEVLLGVFICYWFTYSCRRLPDCSTAHGFLFLDSVLDVAHKKGWPELAVALQENINGGAQGGEKKE